MLKPYQDYESIIWLRLDSIGDNILSSSMLPYIKEKFCNASITVVCQELIAELYKECQFVDSIIIVPSEHEGDNHERFRDTPGRIKAKNPDSSIIWEGHFAGIELGYFQMEKLTNLDKVPPVGAIIYCFPVKIARASAGWVRAVATVPD